MSIKVGERIPSVTLMHMTDKGPAPVTTDDLFGKKKVVLFALPGAFTPTCSARHLPGYVERAADFSKKGVDSIVCLSVNDAFVMNAWGKDQNAAGKVQMVADGKINGKLLKYENSEKSFVYVTENDKNFLDVLRDAPISKVFDDRLKIELSRLQLP